MEIINFEYNHLIVKPEDLDVLCKYSNETIDDLNSEIGLDELGIKTSSLKSTFRDYLEEFYGERNKYVKQENDKVIPMIEEEFANAKFESYSITEDEGLHETLITVKAPRKITGELFRKIENRLKTRDEGLREEVDASSKEALSAKSLYNVFRQLIENEQILNEISERLEW